MNVFIFSTLLAAVFLTACSCHRQTSVRRASLVTRSQIGRICNEIGTLKEEIVTLKNENSNQQKEISMLQQQNIELQSRIDNQGK